MSHETPTKSIRVPAHKRRAHTHERCYTHTHTDIQAHTHTYTLWHTVADKSQRNDAPRTPATPTTYIIKRLQLWGVVVEQ